MYKHMIEILSALESGKIIQFQDMSGVWHDVEIENYVPNFETDEYRVKLETNKFRVGLYKTNNYYHTLTVSDDGTANLREHNDPAFIKWLTGWVEYEV